MRRLWLVFTQWVTIAVAALFVVQTLRPEWLATSATPPPAPKEVVLSQAPAETTTAAVREARADSYTDAVQRALPAVVNIFTAKAIKSPRHPFSNDPLFRRFFGDMLGDEPRAPRASAPV